MSNALASPAPERDPRWSSVVARDRAADGEFVFSVRSTGIYCRASCPAKRPKPENVAFHADAGAAERAGFRPCKRCHPNRPEQWRQNSEVVAEICRLIENSEVAPNLDELARKAGYSPHHFHRMFKAATGMTPRNYANARRADRVRGELVNGSAVTTAIHDAGYGSTSRFYETSSRILGMKPSDYRNGGANTGIRFAIGDSSLGKIMVATTDLGICAIFLGDEPDALVTELQRRFPKAAITAAGADFEKTVAAVVAFVEQPRGGLDLPLDLRGTAFQQRVWNALITIGPGQTATYAEIARIIGAPGAVRAVGTACGANHVSLAVPCHRIVGTDGKLHGYRWGLERKKTLLARERGDKPS